jgi:hypothetical protein
MTDYIYALLCPQGEIRYIGKTTNPEARLAAHISKAKTNQTKHHAANWIRSLINVGEKPAIEIVFEVPEGEPWEPYEIRLIAEFKAEGHRLTNSTGGGDGFFDVSPEAIAKRVAAAKITKAALGYKERISAVMREVRSSPEFREALSLKIKGAWTNPKTRASFLAGMRHPDAVERRKAASSRRYDDPAFGEAHAKRMRELHRTNPEVFAPLKAASQTPEAKAKRRQSLAKVQATPEYREKNLAALAEIKERPEVKVKKAAAARANYEGGGLHQCVQSDEFKADQAERLKGRWRDPEAKAKMHAARWTDEHRAAQAVGLEARREKIAAAMTPEVRAAQGLKMKAYHARKKAEKLASMTPAQIQAEILAKKAKRAAYAKKRNLELKALSQSAT